MDFSSLLMLKGSSQEGYYYCIKDLGLGRKEAIQIFLAEACSNTWIISKQPNYPCLEPRALSTFTHLHDLPYFLQSITTIYNKLLLKRHCMKSQSVIAIPSNTILTLEARLQRNTYFIPSSSIIYGLITNTDKSPSVKILSASKITKSQRTQRPSCLESHWPGHCLLMGDAGLTPLSASSPDPCRKLIRGFLLLWMCLNTFHSLSAHCFICLFIREGKQKRLVSLLLLIGK